MMRVVVVRCVCPQLPVLVAVPGRQVHVVSVGVQVGTGQWPDAVILEQQVQGRQGELQEEGQAQQNAHAHGPPRGGFRS